MDTNRLFNEVSFYNSVGQTKSSKKLMIDNFLEDVKKGTWQDIVIPVWQAKSKEEREQLKKRAPCVTLAGVFSDRSDNGLQSHSGYIAVDIDNLNERVEEVKQKLALDKYVAAAFTSISGRGLCVLFVINPDKHREAFQGISEYIMENYREACDPTSINPSRLRFVSYDPNIYIAEKAARFSLYPKVKPPKKIDKTVFSQNDFDSLLQQVLQRRLDITGGYSDWLRIGFGLAHKFGEDGRYYFHQLSQFSSKYEPKVADKQYDACLKHKAVANEATIATVYHYCKQAGLEIYSQRTKDIAYSASFAKKSGLGVAEVAENLKKFKNIEGAEDIIKQVMDNGIEINEDSLIDQLKIWMQQNYDLRRNEITRYIEEDSKPLKQTDLNSIYIKAKTQFDRLSYELLERLINSDFIPNYNPFYEFFEKYKDYETDGAIRSLFDTIHSDNSEWVYHFGEKWIVGLISSLHYSHSVLMLVLLGEKQNTGKTEFFRRLLPEELKAYYAESKLDAGKDDEILMTQKAIIMDDEMGGKSKKEEKKLKDLTSKQVFSLREPYGRNNVDLVRIAVLAGTTNETEILNDYSGNRRIIPVKVYGIDHDAYNKVDKISVIMEAYKLWKANYQWRLNREDIEYLEAVDQGKEFQVSTVEGELIAYYFTPGDLHYTGTQIKVKLETHTRANLSLDKIGKELKRLGFQKTTIRVNGLPRKVWLVNEVNHFNSGFAAPQQPSEDTPF